MRGIFLLIVLCLILPGDVRPETIRIGIAWYLQSAMADRVAQGFSAHLKAAAPEIEVEWQTALPTPDAFTRTVHRFEQEKHAMVLLRSYSASYLARNPPRIPTFIGGCNSPLYLGAIRNLNEPEGMITGVSYFLPYELRLDPFMALLPDMHSVLLLTHKGHPGSAIDRAGTRTVCRQLGIRLYYKNTSSPEELQNAVITYRNRVSAIILGNQAQVFRHTADLVETAGDTPVLAYTAEAVRMGALCSLSVDDFKLGRELATLLIAVVREGQSIRKTPVRFDRQPFLHINMKTAKRLNLQVPLNILKIATLHHVGED